MTYPDYSLMQGQPMQPGMRPPGAPGAPGLPAPGAMPPPAMGAARGGQLDPAMVQAILEMQGLGTARSGIARQQALADQLRADAAQGLQPGKGYRPGVANLAASLFTDYKAGQGEKDRQAQLGQLDEQTQGARRRFFEGYSKTLGQ